ncbi:hypothetical protein [Methylorubrum aminovorans]|uniref:hypothetical protein n=1 Tax=Methylorubrum aminovorans TaxID=269069 RepID=UPI003C2BC435
MSATAPTVAETGAPLSVIVQAERDAARAFGHSHGLLIGGASMAQGALSQLGSALNLIEQAASAGADPAIVASYATRLEREAAALLGRLVAARIEATATDSREAA